MNSHGLLAFFLSLLLLPLSGNAACFDEAAARYRIPVDILRAISKVESSGKINAINVNKNGSKDLGHMQINSSWLPTLKKYGITQENIMDPCINTHVGAWVLAGNIKRLGYNWDAIGAYNAVTPSKRQVYARKIAAALNKNHSGKVNARF
ncbi:MAG TPA: lytic transglycosylase domain-containing protein [Rhodocyclaceae bacterium]|nr:lytic transglycosylase domain-containing protein [Rhodocyclaceae bacterium]